MHNEPRGEAAVRVERASSWFRWAGQHPGVVLLGALAMALLALRKPPQAAVAESDASDEEVPLFI